MMNQDQHTPNAENLRRMSYSELRKVAAKCGIHQRMKGEKLITAILSKNSDTDESFSTPVAKEINSSRKNKEKRFDEVQMTPLATARRGTYLLDSPRQSAKIEDLSSASLAVNVSVLDMSNVSVTRGSERKLRSRKVSFMSPAVTPKTPRNQGLRNRPKTPIASRTPLNESMSSTTFSEQHNNKPLEESFSVTPQANIFKFEAMSESSIAQDTTNSSLISSTFHKEKEVKRRSRTKLSPKNVKSIDTKAVVTKQPTSLKKGTTPDFRRIHQKAFEKMESIDDYQNRKLLNSAKKLQERPDLRSRITKAKSKIPAYGGIPFIPSVSSNTSKNLGSKISKKVTSLPRVAAGKHKAAIENTPQATKSKLDLKAKKLSRRATPQLTKSDLKRNNLSKRENTPQSVKSKSKFDLKESLSRKLSYRPYRGPVKPLSESNSLHTSGLLNVKAPVINKVVNKNRSQTRSAIRGVRMNKRFELQMKNRKFD